MSLQSVVGDNNIQILVKDSQNVHVDVSGTRVASLYVPPFRKQPKPGKIRNDLELLLATSAITELNGREKLWQSCLDRCNNVSVDPLSVRCITGRGGSGKTRFALEFVHH